MLLGTLDDVEGVKRVDMVVVGRGRGLLRLGAKRVAKQSHCQLSRADLLDGIGRWEKSIDDAIGSAIDNGGTMLLSLSEGDLRPPWDGDGEKDYDGLFYFKGCGMRSISLSWLWAIPLPPLTPAWCGMRQSIPARHPRIRVYPFLEGKGAGSPALSGPS